MKNLVCSSLVSSSELLSVAPNICKYKAYKINEASYKTARGLLAYAERLESDFIASYLTPGDIKEIEINIEWSTRGVYGWQAFVESAFVRTADGWACLVPHDSHAHMTTGCGYDKLSECLASCLNSVPCMLSKVFGSSRRYKIARTKKKAPYGFSFFNGKLWGFSGGVGASSICHCLTWMGAKVEASEGRTWNRYKITF